MANATVSGVYAAALLDLAEEQGLAAAVVAAAPMVSAAFNRDIIQALQQPGLGQAAARQAIQAALGEAPQQILHLALLLLERGRLGDLPSILAHAVALFQDRHGIKQVTVTTAAPLSAPAEERVVKALHIALGAGARITNRVDPAIIGGMTLRYDDTLVDGSVRRSLDEMRMAMLSVPVGSGLWTSA